MNKPNPFFYFEQPLKRTQLDFWEPFLDNFPFDDFRSFQSAMHFFSGDVKIKTNNHIDFQYLYTNLSIYKTTEELIDNVAKISIFNDVAQTSFCKILQKFQKSIPDSKPIDIFLLTIYCGRIQDINFELNEEYIKLTNIQPNRFINKTHVPELSVFTNLMSGRINDIIPSINIEPIKFKETNNFIMKTEQENKYFISLEYNEKEFFSNNNKIINISRKKKKNETLELDFLYTVSSNSEENKFIFSGLSQQQENFNNIINFHYLNSKFLPINQPKKRTLRI